jgi:3-methyladenine DNA glycosylase/8-oxoguanine DNA glycosylase
VIAADSIYRRLLDLCGSSINPENILKLKIEELRAVVLSFRKAGYLQSK